MDTNPIAKALAANAEYQALRQQFIKNQERASEQFLFSIESLTIAMYDLVGVYDVNDAEKILAGHISAMREGKALGSEYHKVHDQLTTILAQTCDNAVPTPAKKQVMRTAERALARAGVTESSDKGLDEIKRELARALSELL